MKNKFITKGNTLCGNMKERISIQLYKLMIVIFASFFVLTTFISNYNTASILVYAMLASFVVVKF